MNRKPSRKSFLLLFLFSVLLSYSSNIAAEELAYHHHLKATQNPEAVIQWAQDHLSQTGVLHEDKGGFVYLKVDDNYINQLFPLLHDPQYIKPPYFRRPDSPGAHISVFYSDERNQTGKILEIGQSFSFKISNLDVVPPKSHEYIVLKVASPELEELRKKYGLQPLLKGHDFHITIAKKRRY